MRIVGFPLVLMLTLAVAAVSTAVPVAALAQSAGDDQYVDPFQNDGSGNNQNAGGDSGSQGGGGGGGETTTAPPTDIPESTADDTITPQSATGSVTTAQDGAALPRSGLPVLGLAAIGALLLGGGAALRRRA